MSRLYIPSYRKRLTPPDLNRPILFIAQIFGLSMLNCVFNLSSNLTEQNNNGNHDNIVQITPKVSRCLRPYAFPMLWPHPSGKILIIFGKACP